MTPIINYLKETRRELEHVSWPTQHQTIVYTILVALVSIGTAVYLGAFDFVFTTGLGRIVQNTLTSTQATPSQQITQQQEEATTTATSTEPNFTINPATSTTN